jgi:uncharacterized protein (DUF1684 family)
MTSLLAFRDAKDSFFADSPGSPLTAAQKQAFTGLNYFSENNDLRFEVTPDKNVDPEVVEVQTSTGDTEPFTRYARVRFRVGADEAVLTIFKGKDDDLFLPFKDTTNGSGTYEAGRYLEPTEIDGKILLDFNLAYNPYCAYADSWRCPLTPAENHLKVAIEAGEKKFHTD